MNISLLAMISFMIIIIYFHTNNKPESFITNKPVSPTPDIQPRKIYNELEKKYYNLKEDCIFDSECILPLNGHSAHNYICNTRKKNEATFLSNEFIKSRDGVNILCPLTHSCKGITREHINVADTIYECRKSNNNDSLAVKLNCLA